MGPVVAATTDHLLHVATVVAPRTTDHLLSSTFTSVKHVALLPFQLVQNPSLLSFQVPSPCTPAARLTGSRVIFPSAMNTILNLMFDGVDEVNAWPLKNVSWISFGVSLVTARAAVPATSRPPTAQPRDQPRRYRRYRVGFLNPAM